jgi:hypothetical protein
MRHAATRIAAAAIVAVTLAGKVAASDTRPASVPSARPTPPCAQSTFHPISVHVTALDPVARGAVVRLVLRVSSAVAFDQIDAQMTSTGGASNRGPLAVAMGAVVPGRPAEATFTVAVPPGGGRQYVQFKVSGRGPYGLLTRGACYNLLPDGPAEHGRVVTTTAGDRVLEVRAGRIDQ